MTIRKRLATLLLAALAVTALALPAAAKDRTVTIIDDEGVTYRCTYVDGQFLRVVNQDTGEQVLDFDMDEVEEAVEEAMEGVQEALEALEGLDFDFRFGDDNHVRFEMGDERVFVDFDGIMESVMSVLEDLDESEIHVNDFHWDSDHDDHDHDHEAAALKDELRELRDEVRRLKRELRDSDRRSRH